MGHINQNYIKDNFSFHTLNKELTSEKHFLKKHPHEIEDDAFWQKIETSYHSNPHRFLHDHQCACLDNIVIHDRIEPPPHHITVPCDNDDYCRNINICEMKQCNAVPEPSTWLMFLPILLLLLIGFSRRRR